LEDTADCVVVVFVAVVAGAAVLAGAGGGAARDGDTVAAASVTVGVFPTVADVVATTSPPLWK
jgi:hypothetical protein